MKTTCSICLNKCDKNCYTLIGCGHIFHYSCIRKCVQRCGRSCPLCRDNIIDTNFYENDPAFKDLNISSLKEIENSDDYVEW